MKRIIAMFSLLMLLTTSAFAEFTEGKHYKVIDEQKTDTGSKIEVLEFFWYGCPHCNKFEPFVKNWKDSAPSNVVFKRVPAVFRPSWKVQARAYYALESMGKLEDVHQHIFDAIHKDRKKLNSMNDMADLVANKGVDRDAFIKQYRSFNIDGQVRKANKKLKGYGITGVPTVAVNGKYIITGSTAGSYPKMIEIMDHLVEKESK